MGKKKEANKKPKKPGAKPKNLPQKDPFEQLCELCEMQCTQQEIENYFGIALETIQRIVKEKTGLDFSEFQKQKKERGKQNLRRVFFKKALSDNPQNNSVLIFAAKNALGYSDRIETGEIGENAEYTRQSPEEIENRLNELAKKQLKEDE